MRICLIALCVLGRAVSGVSAVGTHDVPIATTTFDDQKFKIARSVTSRIPPNHNVAPNLRGSRATAAFAAGTDRVLKEDDNNGEEENGQGQVEECDKDCEKARKEDEKAKEKAEKEAAKAADEAAKNAAKAAEKENEDSPIVVPAEDEPETIELADTTPNEEKPDETTNAVLIEDEAALLAPSDNTDGQDGATDEETPAAATAEEEEPEVAGADGPFVVAVPPTSVKEDLGDDNKAVLPPPTEDNTIFDITTEDEGTTIQNNKPTVVDVSINDGDGFPGPVKTDTDSGLTFSSSSSSSANDGGLQPVGKALLSVALAGVFVAFVAVLLLRRQRRSSFSDPANAFEITPYSPSKDDSYFVDRDESYDDTPDVEKQIVTVDTAGSSPAPTPEKVSSTHDHEDANDDEEESSQSASLTCSFSENVLSMLPCQLDISPCSKPTMPEASTDDSTSAAPLPPDVRVVAAPSTRPSKVEGEESEENFPRNNTARELMRKYKMDDTVKF